MKQILTARVSRRALAAVAVLTLIASVVMGRENPAPPPPAPVERTAPAASKEPAADIDLEALRRPRKGESVSDLFAPRDFAPPPAPGPEAAAAPPPEPSAPPLPFHYLGKLIDGEQHEVFVARGEDHYSVSKGRTIDGRYKVENVTDKTVTFLYLPLGVRQTLAIPKPN